MGAAVLVEAPGARSGEAWSLFDGAPEPTLDDAVGGAWRALRANAIASCPLCGGEMRPRATAAGPPKGGRCQDCGSELS